ncbi:GHKL domain-containing protein [Christensenellaceae bacterium OttesenSCG-928-K19]|nr:GHKL domain-containing protein [Christensenellaceae bacterium OttesenSCG-928-K19]
MQPFEVGFTFSEYMEVFLYFTLTMAVYAVMGFMPVRGRTRRSAGRTAGFMLVWTLPGFAVLSFLFLQVGLGTNLVMITMALILFLAYCRAVEAPFTKLLFILMTVAAVDCFVSGIANIIAYMTDPTIMTSIHVTFVIPYAILVAVFFLFYKFTFAKQLEWMVEHYHYMPVWRILWAIPLAFSVIMMFDLTYIDDGIHEPASYIFVLVLTFVAVFIVYFIIHLMMRRTYEKASLEKNMKAMDQVMLMQREQYVLMQKNAESIRRMQHDMRHHMSVLAGLFESSDEAGMKKYLADYMEDLDFLERKPVCENYALNIILLNYMDMAQKLGVDVRLSCKLPKELPVVESDLCVIVGNLMENAVEACARQEEKKRHIDFFAGIAGDDMVAVTVKNSYAGLLKKEGSVLMSSKQDGQGIGLLSVREIAKKHNGVVNIEYTEKEFSVSVLMTPTLQAVYDEEEYQ